jgi:hypothetical protein
MVTLLGEIIGYYLSVSLRRGINCFLGVCSHRHTTFVMMLTHCSLLVDRGFTVAALSARGGESAYGAEKFSVENVPN